MQIVLATQRDTSVFHPFAEHKNRQLAGIFMKRIVGAIFWMRVILRFWESAKANVLV